MTLLTLALIDVAAGRCPRLAVFMPPRHGKSELISKYFPAWFLGNFPDKRVMLTSHEADFAATWGSKARTLLDEYGEPLWGVTVSKTSAARNRWDINDHLGGMMTAGVGGSITGRGADLLIVDDPVKSAAEANSEVKRESAWDWWRSTARTRLEPGGAAVLVQTRWHEDDLGGRILDDDSEEWRVINLPAIAEDDDALGRLPGEALWPERFDVEALEAIQRQSGAYWWNALYQQRPAPLEGGIIQARFFRYFTEDEENYYLDGSIAVKKNTCGRIQFVDLAVSTKTYADYFVIGTFAYTPQGDRLVLDIYRDRLEGPDQPSAILAKYAAFLPSWIGVEATSYQLSLVQELTRQGLPVRPVYPDTDKVSRAITLGVQYEQGRWYHRREAPWLPTFESELLSFPMAAHDDQVDVAGYAAREGEVGGVGTGGGGRQTAAARTFAGSARRTYGNR